MQEPMLSITKETAAHSARVARQDRGHAVFTRDRASAITPCSTVDTTKGQLLMPGLRAEDTTSYCVHDRTEG